MALLITVIILVLFWQPPQFLGFSFLIYWYNLVFAYRDCLSIKPTSWMNFIICGAEFLFISNIAIAMLYPKLFLSMWSDRLSFLQHLGFFFFFNLIKLGSLSFSVWSWSKYIKCNFSYTGEYAISVFIYSYIKRY